MCLPRKYVESCKTPPKSGTKTIVPPRHSKIRWRLCYRAERENWGVEKGSTTSTSLSRSLRYPTFLIPKQLTYASHHQEGTTPGRKTTARKKAPGPDQIPNKVIKVIISEISNNPVHIFNNSLSIGYYPSHLKESIIVILRRQGSARDYTNLKSYRPISLLNTLGKIMEAVLAARISYMATTHHLLLETHFGGWRGSFIETAIHHLFEKIYAAWNKDKIASLLIVDVSAAYPNTSHQRLLHNLRKWKIDGKVVNWVVSFLTKRQTIVKTNEHTAPKLYTDLGLPQGSPLSSILYLFYNADLLDDCAKKGVGAQGYIDDITLISTSKLVKGNTQKLA